MEENEAPHSSEDESLPNNFSWDMNYLEAAIFLQEGENNDKFNSHPREQSALPAYLITHNQWFYFLDFSASLLLLFLAVMEQPAISAFKDFPIGVHGSLELFGLAILGISIAMQVRWLGWKTFVYHKRSVLKSATWIIMVSESIAVLINNATHFRVTRSLRPIFLIDNRYMGGVRRFLRQIFQSLLPIIEVLTLLFFTLIIFTILGFYLFSTDENDPYFTTFHDGFVSLYVLLTTANFPDVMMPSYANSRWSAAFFIGYLAITLYFLMNLMLAIVFVAFSDIEKEKFLKLLMHKREACQHAFRLLVTNQRPNQVSFKHFEGLMHYYNKNLSRKEVYLVFKTLNKSKSGYLSLMEFFGLYDTLEYRWRAFKGDELWFSDLATPIKSTCSLIRSLVVSKWFKGIVYFVILSNAASLLVRTIYLSSGSLRDMDLRASWDQLICVSFYVVELTLKLIGLGFSDFFKSGWNSFDFVIVCLSVCGIIAENIHRAFFYVVILRPLRLLRLFKMRRRYRDIFQTFSMLLPTIIFAIIVIIIIYFFFAIIGMELFSQYEMKNCCVNTTVEQFYKDDNTTLYVNYYYLNNFDNLFMAGVTLFELTIVNNWFIIMEGYAAVSGDWSRTYFMLFYLVMMVVMSIVMAFILEAFTFKMHYNEAFKDNSTEGVKMHIALKKEELDFVYAGEKNLKTLHEYSATIAGKEEVIFEGNRKRTKLVLQRRMYRDMIQEWLQEYNSSYQNLIEAPALNGNAEGATWTGDLPSQVGDESTSFFQWIFQPNSEFNTENPSDQLDHPIFPSSIQSSVNA